MIINYPQKKIMTSKSAFEISSDQKVHLVSAANKIGKFCWPGRPGKLSKVHFSRKFQGKVHLNFWLSGSTISPYFHPKNLPIPPKVYLLKVQGTKSKASIDFHCPLWQILLSSHQLIRIQTLLSPLWSNLSFCISYISILVHSVLIINNILAVLRYKWEFNHK